MNIQPTYVTFEQAKLLKEKGFDLEVECFYSKNGQFNWLKPHREYEHLHNYSNIIQDYFNGKYNWNSLNVDEGMVCLKTAFSECDEWCNCECSAPEQWQVVEWLRVEKDIWVQVEMNYWSAYGFKVITFKKAFSNPYIDEMNETTTLQEAYSAAFDYILTKLI